MATESGWWTLDINTEAEQVDLDHIGDMIKQGYTSGEICGTEGELEE